MDTFWEEDAGLLVEFFGYFANKLKWWNFSIEFKLSNFGWQFSSSLTTKFSFPEEWNMQSGHSVHFPPEATFPSIETLRNTFLKLLSLGVKWNSNSFVYPIRLTETWKQVYKPPLYSSYDEICVRRKFDKEIESKLLWKMESRQGVEKGPAQKFAANRLQKDRKEGQNKTKF